MSSTSATAQLAQQQHISAASASLSLILSSVSTIRVLFFLLYKASACSGGGHFVGSRSPAAYTTTELV
jgi:hypothetical protein